MLKNCMLNMHLQHLKDICLQRFIAIHSQKDMASIFGFAMFVTSTLHRRKLMKYLES